MTRRPIKGSGRGVTGTDTPYNDGVVGEMPRDETAPASWVGGGVGRDFCGRFFCF